MKKKKNASRRGSLLLAPLATVPSDGAPDSRRSIDFGKYDPATMREKLGVNGLAEALFPTITSGVRFWPFLVVAKDFRASTKTAIDAELARIKKRIRGQTGNRRRIGPGHSQSFLPYHSMLQKIELRAGKDPSAKELASFLAHGNRHFSGQMDFFSKHEKAWRKALLKSLPKAGRQFARLIDTKSVDEAVEHIIRHSTKFEAPLCKAATCYALLVCLYGVRDGGKVVSKDVSEKWPGHLLNLKDAELKILIFPLRELLKRAQEDPPLKKAHQKASEEERDVLAAFRFNTIQNLYRDHTPK